MFAAVSQSKAPSGGSLAPEPIIQTDGRAEIRFKHGINGTSLDHLYHHDPVRVVFPTPALGDILPRHHRYHFRWAYRRGQN